MIVFPVRVFTKICVVVVLDVVVGIGRKVVVVWLQDFRFCEKVVSFREWIVFFFTKLVLFSFSGFLMHFQVLGKQSSHLNEK